MAKLRGDLSISLDGFVAGPNPSQEEPLGEGGNLLHEWAFAAQSWREERAKLQVGAPVSYPVTAGALQALALAQQADPEGRWLLPVAAYTTDSDRGARRVFVDASRWKSVVGDFFADTSSAPLA